MAKRAQVELPVVFIFAVIVGILVLSAVGYIVIRQQASAENERQLESLVRIRTALVSLEGVPNVLQNITVPDGVYQYDCDETTGSKFSVDGDNEVQFPAMILFAPRELSGGRLTVATAITGDGFSVATLVYVISPPTKITKRDIWWFPYPTFGDDPSITHTYNGKNPSTTAMTVSSSPNFPSVGTVTFPATSKSPGGTRIYLGEAFLAGAGATADVDTYTCALTRYLHQLAFTNNVQHERMLYLQNQARLDGNACEYWYRDEPLLAIDDILVDRTGLTPKFRPVTAMGMSQVENLASAMQNLTLANENLLRGSNCATIS